MITQELLQRRFDYKDGHLIYKIKTANCIKVGKVAGHLCNDTGYIRIGIQGRLVGAHRLIWIYHNGDIPDSIEIDHSNNIKHDNRIENLRLATHSQNQFNTVKYKNNTSGYKGVYFCQNKWVAEIKINGKKKYLGRYDTPELASEAYKSAAEEYHKEFANY